ncbi:hypothetical protein O181_052769 [Austropuccinia psidii MF-1]|uniref:Uncharacterized protein n=1 Tax=Austropuccinia psidii MF-1 TaxID=1389203 RepID=A0A9Q3HS10_9BASI|nr:hypothetical protein [Austropuccinia psidii MF-1]
MRTHVGEIVNNTNPSSTYLARSDSERHKLKNEIIAHIEKTYRNYEPNSHIPRHSTPLIEERAPMKESSTPFLGENAICAKDIPILERWPTISGEGEYHHIDLIRMVYMVQEDFHILSEIIVGKLHSLFTRSAKKWYYKIRQDHGKQYLLWWKSEIITKWANNYWRFKMDNAFGSPILTQESINHLIGSSNKKTDNVLYTQICLTQ